MLPFRATTPKPVMVILVALLLVHVRTQDWPLAILVGDAVKVTVGGAVEAPTVTVAFAEAVPPGPVAVTV